MSKSRRPQKPPSTSQDAFSAHCRELLILWWRESGLTQRQVADKMQWKEQTSVSQYFRKRSDLSLDQAARMAAVFGRSIQDLAASWEGKPMQQRNERRERWLLIFERASPEYQDALLSLIDLSLPVRREMPVLESRRRVAR